MKTFVAIALLEACVASVGLNQGHEGFRDARSSRSNVVSASNLSISHQDFSVFPPLPIIDISAGYLLGQSSANATSPSTLVDGPIQCGPGNPCLDGSCCNSDGKCGFKPAHCHPNPPATCISNCDAKAMCGVDSEGGNKKCGLKLCCSYYGWCGTEAIHCGDHDQDGNSTPCQKDFGSCTVKPSPSCGSGSGTASGGRKVAYYQSWNTRTRACNRIWPEQINTTGLTHLYFAFAYIDPATYSIVPADPADVELIPRFTALKTQTMQTWVAVGGWSFSDPGPTQGTWSAMTSSKEHRALFITSVVSFMDQWGFQGLDLDWEYPATEVRGGHEGDTANLVSLVQELRAAFGSRYGLSVILAPDYWYLRGMDPKAMEPYVDWFGFMGYDLHGAWDAAANTIGATVRPQSDIRDIDNDLVPLWFDDLDPHKVNFGLAYYGRGYTVSDKKCMYMGCAFTGPSKAGSCTQTEGFLSDQEIRNIIESKGLYPEMIPNTTVKQITWEDQWIGYDDQETFDMKMAFANNRCLGGTMIWAIDFNS
ncbi:glycoside hydrolase [Lophium mytilinum]|uniref:chitinase n=1 Tax=Lophium mytilinum TaxID=390894 RepID=A0A6A6QK27_9PEZI|nr:glycoside hydrolase [Lophium mytilinum]